MLSRYRQLLVRIAEALLFVIVAFIFWHQTPIKAALLGLVGIAFVVAISIYPQRRRVWFCITMFLLYFISDSDLVGWGKALGMSTLIAVIMGLLALGDYEKRKSPNRND